MSATHVVGGEVTYVYLGNNLYRVRIDIYRDCINGDPQAILQDDPAYISIFLGNGTRILSDSIKSSSQLIVPDNFSNDCINNKPITCLNRITFIKNYSLPSNPAGYYIVYQRCCRNANILNIVDPGSTGATYYCVIPPSGEFGKVVNNSAVFKNYPPQIICINNPLFYDNSATDADGDSLSYEFCTAYNGGSANDAKPVPMSLGFQSVRYSNSNSFNAKQPMGPGNSSLKIDPVTGLITGTPFQSGRFVVTVCCHEWRNGVIINTVTREFQFVVTNCSKAVVANIPQLSSQFNTFIVQCKGYTVKFKNLSIGANNASDAYSWDFGVPGIKSDTSHLKEPEYTYPDTGVYVVKLIVNRGSTCVDSIMRYVKIYPSFNVDFDYTGLPCPLTPINFINKTTSTYQPILNFNWNFGDGTSSTEFEPQHVYDTGGNFSVILSASNIKGCYDSTVKTVSVTRFKAFAGNDTVIVKGESIIFNATGGNTYTWTPATNLSNPNIANPIGYYPDTGTFYYVVHVESSGGCVGEDTIKVWVVGQGAVFVPSAFSPNGDGLNDVLRPIGVGYRNINFFRVFNRWGQPVFYSSRFGAGWDGKYQGKTADVGTYYWVLSIKDRFGKDVLMKGDTALIR
ncbi:MAG: PKD domain-containing protein [Chitinophagaceae bacterium]